MKNKIGVGVITYNRQDYFEKCVASIPEVEEFVVINDGDPYPSNAYPSKVKEVIQHTRNKCVGVSKNEALRYLIQAGCDHLFLFEDDMEVLNPNVFEKYIKAAEGSGIWHLNYGPGSPFNRVQKPGQRVDLDTRHELDQESPPNPRIVFECENGSEIALYQHTVAMFSYFLRGIIKAVGYMDERYHNAWEHVDHTYRIIQAGLHPPFWWFADVANSDKLLREIKGAIENSSIAKDKTQWEKNIREGMNWYAHKHGHVPAQTPDTSVEQVKIILSQIEQKYARKVL